MRHRILRIATRVGKNVGPAHGHVQIVIGAPDQTRRGNTPVEALGNEDVTHLGQRTGIQTTTRQRDGYARFSISVDRLGVRQIYDAIILWVYGDIHQTGSIGFGKDLRYTRNITIEQLAASNHPQLSLITFRDENVTIPPKGHPPGM